ncbi:MAG: hypothetical protein JSS09_05750, partial [Verrucomicrobia bacterium]|nr:hypothetical protein [Verrucomicrobiota bacterium]
MLSDYLVKLKKIQVLSGKLFFFCCLLFCSFQTERPQNSGLFPHFPLQDALQVISRFLPHNPTIYLMEETDILRKKCLDMWPLAHIISSPDLLDMPIDFVWIDLDSIPKTLLKNLQQALKTATALYKTESLHSQTQPVFRVLAVASNFSLCSQWYNENQESGSFFLTNPLYDALVRGLSFDPSSYTTPILNALPIYLEQFLSPVATKSSFHSFSPIDCVYMINLDERPEKFSLSCAQLEPYDIHPYRFSAINGWKLSSENINNLGIRLENIPCSNTYIGTVFKKVEDKEYRMHELINKLDTTYFCPGMTR